MKMKDTYQVNQHWKELEDRIVKPQQVVLVIGATDVGKSTFCRFLIEAAVDRGLKTAFVDTDVGQSQIGPPTTIGMKSFDPESAPVQFNGIADQLYFVGDLSPHGHALEVLTGTRLMVDRARETEADFIVVDTSGYLHGTAAITLKQHKIRLINPTSVICIGRGSELEQITAGYRQQAWLDIHYLLPHRNVRVKSIKARTDYRKSRFHAYFGAACEPEPVPQTSDDSIQSLPFEQIRGERTPFFIGRIANTKELETLSRLAETQIDHAEWGHRTLCLITSEPLSRATLLHIKNYFSLRRVTAEVYAYFERRVIGLVDSSGDTYAIGILEALDLQKREFSIRCPFSNGDAAAKRTCAIQFGSYQLNG